MLRAAAISFALLLGCSRPSPDASTSTTTAAHGSGPAAAIVLGAPVSDGEATPSASPAAVRVIIGGDVIPHRPSLSEPEAVVSALAPLKPLFEAADVVVANYEATTGALEKKAFRLSYAAPPAWLAALPSAGIKAVTIANNHACDLGYEGLDATLATAEKAEMTVLGGDANSDPWAPRTIAERDGKRVCAIAWTTISNAEGGCARSTRLAVAPPNAAGRQKVAAAMQRARSTCDATIAILHGGIEYVPQTPEVMTFARQAADAGADAVVIHHPHIASPVVVHGAKDGRKIPIFASIGNLVSNQGESWKPPMFPVLRENRRLVCVNGWTRLGVLADLSFSFAADGPRLDWSYHLLWTENEHAEDRTARVPKISTRLLDPDKDAAIVERLSDDEKGPVDLFDDPCWVERPVYTEGDRERDPRCGTTLVRTTPPASPTARARKALNARTKLEARAGAKR